MKKVFVLFVLMAIPFSSVFAGDGGYEKDMVNFDQKAADKENEGMDSQNSIDTSALSKADGNGFQIGEAGIAILPAKAVQEMYTGFTKGVNSLLGSGSTKESKPHQIVFHTFLTVFYLISTAYFVFRKLAGKTSDGQDMNLLEWVNIAIKFSICLVIFTQLSVIPDKIVSLAQDTAMFLSGSQMKNSDGSRVYFKIVNSAIVSDAAVGVWLTGGMLLTAVGMIIIAPSGAGLDFDLIKNVGVAVIASAIFAIVGAGMMSAIYAFFCLNLYLGAIIAIFYLPATMFNYFGYDIKAMWKFLFANFLEVFLLTYELIIFRKLNLTSDMTGNKFFLFMFPAVLPGVIITFEVATVKIVTAVLRGNVANVGDLYTMNKNFAAHAKDGDILGAIQRSRIGIRPSDLAKLSPSYIANNFKNSLKGKEAAQLKSASNLEIGKGANLDLSFNLKPTANDTLGKMNAAVKSAVNDRKELVQQIKELSLKLGYVDKLGRPDTKSFCEDLKQFYDDRAKEGSNGDLREYLVEKFNAKTGNNGVNVGAVLNENFDMYLLENSYNDYSKSVSGNSLGAKSNYFTILNNNIKQLDSSKQDFMFTYTDKNGDIVYYQEGYKNDGKNNRVKSVSYDISAKNADGKGIYLKESYSLSDGFEGDKKTDPNSWIVGLDGKINHCFYKEDGSGDLKSSYVGNINGDITIKENTGDKTVTTTKHNDGSWEKSVTTKNSDGKEDTHIIEKCALTGENGEDKQYTRFFKNIEGKEGYDEVLSKIEYKNGCETTFTRDGKVQSHIDERGNSYVFNHDGEKAYVVSYDGKKKVSVSLNKDIQDIMRNPKDVSNAVSDALEHKKDSDDKARDYIAKNTVNVNRYYVKDYESELQIFKGNDGNLYTKNESGAVFDSNHKRVDATGLDLDPLTTSEKSAVMKDGKIFELDRNGNPLKTHDELVKELTDNVREAGEYARSNVVNEEKLQKHQSMLKQFGFEPDDVPPSKYKNFDAFDGKVNSDIKKGTDGETIENINRIANSMTERLLRDEQNSENELINRIIEKQNDDTEFTNKRVERQNTDTVIKNQHTIKENASKDEAIKNAIAGFEEWAKDVRGNEEYFKYAKENLTNENGSLLEQNNFIYSQNAKRSMEAKSIDLKDLDTRLNENEKIQATNEQKLQESLETYNKFMSKADILKSKGYYTQDQIDEYTKNIDNLRAEVEAGRKKIDESSHVREDFESRIAQMEAKVEKQNEELTAMQNEQKAFSIYGEAEKKYEILKNSYEETKGVNEQIEAKNREISEFNNYIDTKNINVKLYNAESDLGKSPANGLIDDDKEQQKMEHLIEKRYFNGENDSQTMSHKKYEDLERMVENASYMREEYLRNNLAQFDEEKKETVIKDFATLKEGMENQAESQVKDTHDELKNLGFANYKIEKTGDGKEKIVLRGDDEENPRGKFASTDEQTKNILGIEPKNSNNKLLIDDEESELEHNGSKVSLKNIVILPKDEEDEKKFSNDDIKNPYKYKDDNISEIENPYAAKDDLIRSSNNEFSISFNENPYAKDLRSSNNEDLISFNEKPNGGKDLIRSSRTDDYNDSISFNEKLPNGGKDLIKSSINSYNNNDTSSMDTLLLFNDNLNDKSSINSSEKYAYRHTNIFGSTYYNRFNNVNKTIEKPIDERPEFDDSQNDSKIYNHINVDPNEKESKVEPVSNHVSNTKIETETPKVDNNVEPQNNFININIVSNEKESEVEPVSNHVSNTKIETEAPKVDNNDNNVGIQNDYVSIVSDEKIDPDKIVNYSKMYNHKGSSGTDKLDFKKTTVFIREAVNDDEDEIDIDNIGQNYHGGANNGVEMNENENDRNNTDLKQSVLVSENNHNSARNNTSEKIDSAHIDDIEDDVKVNESVINIQQDEHKDSANKTSSRADLFKSTLGFGNLQSDNDNFNNVEEADLIDYDGNVYQNNKSSCKKASIFGSTNHLIIGSNDNEEEANGGTFGEVGASDNLNIANQNDNDDGNDGAV